MDTFDYVIVIIGVLLIIIGLFLFVSGKRDTESANNVEGFGIKLNVSNPSIILIVFGIGLVLFPRLMPQNPTVITDPTGPIQQPTDMPAQHQTSQTPRQSSVFFPRGVWYLSSYEENGVDLSSAIEGNIQFGQLSGDTQTWLAAMAAVDAWGNVMNYQYEGNIHFNASQGYRIDTTRSNDPSFSYAGPTPLTLKIDDDGRLHMEYFFNGSAIMLHWQQ